MEEMEEEEEEKLDFNKERRGSHAQRSTQKV